MSNTITFPKKVCIFKDEGGKMMQLEMLNFHILLLTHGMGVVLMQTLNSSDKQVYLIHWVKGDYIQCGYSPKHGQFSYDHCCDTCLPSFKSRLVTTLYDLIPGWNSICTKKVSFFILIIYYGTICWVMDSLFRNPKVFFHIVLNNSY